MKLNLFFIIGSIVMFAFGLIWLLNFRPQVEKNCIAAHTSYGHTICDRYGK